MEFAKIPSYFFRSPIVLFSIFMDDSLATWHLIVMSCSPEMSLTADILGIIELGRSLCSNDSAVVVVIKVVLAITTSF